MSDLDLLAERTPVESWAYSGAMALTGTADGPPQLVAGEPGHAVLSALRRLAGTATAMGLDTTALPDERLLGERAAVMGLARRGRISAGGASRLLEAADGTVALTLSRPDDLTSVPALVGGEAGDDPWQSVTDWCRSRTATEVVERARLLGLAAGAVDHTLPQRQPEQPEPAAHPPARAAAPLVVDLSSLWAGPLCAHLLGLLGARVIDVESTRRPDPSRDFAPEFHRLLRNGAQRCTLDFAEADGRSRLRDLLLHADIVIEASRPRALAQLGIDADAITSASGGTWVSITAYGREHNRIGYGDDVAAAAGLLGGGPVFAGDAIADPLTGCHAAAAALDAWSCGRSGVVEVSMYDVVRSTRTELANAVVVRDGDGWAVDDGDRLIPVAPPAARQASRWC
ncbi:MAG TPA: CoA transferase [Mycobacteriales bacterium]|nr:CoA transferase [Mycobacteriales bacterium]